MIAYGAQIPLYRRFQLIDIISGLKVKDIYKGCLESSFRNKIMFLIFSYNVSL